MIPSSCCRSAIRSWIVIVGLACVTSLSVNGPLPAQFGGGRFQLEESQLYSWAFENQSSVEGARKRSSDLLEGQIEFIAVIGNVSPNQRQRLVLAGEGDISRFFAGAEAVINEQPRGNLDQEEWNKVWQNLSPIREQYTQGLTGEGSLFQKTIRSTLTAEQLVEYDKLIEQRDGRNYRALVAATVAELEIKLPLTRERTRLIDIVVAKTKPPEIKLNNYLQYIFVMYRMSQMKDEDLKPIFVDDEFRLLKQSLQQAQGYAAQFERQKQGQQGGFLNWLF